MKSRAFLLRRDASSPPPSGASHGLFYPEIPPPQYISLPVSITHALTVQTEHTELGFRVSTDCRTEGGRGHDTLIAPHLFPSVLSGGSAHTPHTVYSLTKRVSPEMLQTFDATNL